MKPFRILKIAGFVLLGIAAIFVFGSIVMLLWNALLPAIFHLPVITFWQALGLLVLAKLLFGGFSGGGHRGQHWRYNMKMKQRWMNMTPEEREKFKEEWRNRCGGRRFEEQKPIE